MNYSLGDHKLYYRADDDIRVLVTQTETVSDEIKGPKFEKFTKAFFANKSKMYNKNVRIPKETLYKLFFSNIFELFSPVLF